MTSQGVDTTPQVAKLRAASGTRDSFNPAVRFQIMERQPELSSGLFIPEKRDFGAVLSLDSKSEKSSLKEILEKY